MSQPSFGFRAAPSQRLALFLAVLLVPTRQVLDALDVAPAHAPSGGRCHLERMAELRPQVFEAEQLLCLKHQEMTGLETYIVARLEGGQHSPFLDTLELHVAVKFCEMLGAVELFGRMAKLNELSDEDWRRAGAAGFVIAAGGTASIGAYLSRLQATFAYTRGGTEGPQALFGRLYQLLEFGAEDPAYNPLRTLVGEHIRGHLPLDAGDLLFGQP